jgi:hypothetical protein
MKVSQTRLDLEKQMSEQIGFLEKSARLFDDGDYAEAKRLAASLRVLLHETKNSKSLLGQLELLDSDFIDTAGDLNPRNMLTECPLLHMRIGAEPDFAPTLGNVPIPPTPLKFPVWWGKPVFRDDQRKTFSRKDIVLSVANQDGGAHVDPGLDEPYHRLSRENSLAWTMGTQEGRRPAKNPVPASIRQITYEVLQSIARPAINRDQR